MRPPRRRYTRQDLAEAEKAARAAVAERDRIAALVPQPVPRRGELPMLSVLRDMDTSAGEWRAFAERLKSDSGAGPEKRGMAHNTVARHIRMLLLEAVDASAVLAPAISESLVVLLYFAIKLAAWEEARWSGQNAPRLVKWTGRPGPLEIQDAIAGRRLTGDAPHSLYDLMVRSVKKPRRTRKAVATA